MLLLPYVNTTVSIKVRCSPSLYDSQVAVVDDLSSSTSRAVEAPSKRAVESIHTFVRDAMVHRAASRALLALIIAEPATAPAHGQGDGWFSDYQTKHTDAACCVGAVGGATALSRVLATSPNDSEVQLPAVLAIAELLERCGCGSERDCHKCRTRTERIDRSERVGSAEGGAEVNLSEVADGAEKRRQLVSAVGEHTVASSLAMELVSAAACELLCKSAKTFPRNRDLRLGCLRAMAALCRGAGPVAGERLVDSGACEQVGWSTPYCRTWVLRLVAIVFGYVIVKSFKLYPC